MNPFVGYDNIIPLLAPQDIGGTVTASSYMDLKYVQRGAFLVAFGAITSATATDTEVVTLEAATAPGGTEVAMSFRYRVSGALGAKMSGAGGTGGAYVALAPNMRSARRLSSAIAELGDFAHVQCVAGSKSK